jgi:hypothetical protein
MSCVGSPPSRDPSKQVAVQTSCSSRILEMQTNARTVETQDTAHIVHPVGQQLWREINQQKQCQLFDKLPKTKVQTHQRLGKQPLLWQ